MAFHWDFGIAFQYVDLLLFGIAYNIELSLLATILGSLLGALLFWGRTSNYAFLRAVTQIYIEFFLAIPILVLLVWLYFCLPIVGVSVTPFLASLTALGLSNAAFSAELFRGGAAAISRAETDVARAFGFEPGDTLRFIVFPAFAKVTLPPYITLTIDTLKYSTLAAFVTAPEALYTSNLIIAKTFRPLEVYSLLGALFVATIIPMVLFARWLAEDEKSQRRD